MQAISGKSPPIPRSRPVVALAALLTVGVIGSGSAASASHATSQPNVLLIVIDDLRPELNTFGVPDVQTPNIDRLASRGVRFDNAYCQYPVCNPSRSSFLTGKRPDELGIYTNEEPLRRVHPDLVTLPQAFRQAGYRTVGLGKLFHQGLDEHGKKTLFRDDTSFEDSYRALGHSPAIGREGEGRYLGDGGIPWCHWLAAEGGDAAQPDGMLADEALRVLNEPRDRPFFLAVGFHKPHDPFIAPRAYFEPYALEKVSLATDPSDRSPLSRYALPDRSFFSSFTDRDRREFKRAYHACVSFVDAQVGKLMQTVDRLALWDDTIVVLMGDHGYHLGEHGWWNKVTVFELGARTPLIIWAPGGKSLGSPHESPIELLDLYPTLIDLCRVEAPHRLSGESLRPMLEGTAPQRERQAAYTQVRRSGIGMGYSVRTERFRLTQWGRDGEGGVELYEHPSDPNEYHNLAGHSQYSSELERLTELLPLGFPSLAP